MTAPAVGIQCPISLCPDVEKVQLYHQQGQNKKKIKKNPLKFVYDLYHFAIIP